MVRKILKLVEYNVISQHRIGKGNAVTEVVSHNQQECVEVVEDIKVFLFSSLVLMSRKHIIQEQEADADISGSYHFLKDPNEITSLNAPIFEKWSQFLY